MEIARAAAGVACSKEHQRIYAEWFALADPDGDGRVTGADATSFFGMSALSRADLKQVWAIADSKRQGYLGFAEFVTAMQRSKAVVKRVHPDDNGTPQVQAPSIYHWFGSKATQKVRMPLTAVTSVIDGLKRLYVEKLKPLEVAYRYNDFATPLLTNSDFDAKPTVMLLGQYSTGKTTFIKHLLKTSYPGAHVGPEPTTDRFVVVMSGSDGRTIPGNTIAVQADMPFTGLTTFGGAFLSKFECSQMPHPLLEHTVFDKALGGF